MDNNDFINFETAKTARMLGFDLDSFACYDEDGGFINGLYDFNFTVCNHNKYEEIYSAPLKSDLQKWLIKEFGIFVNADVLYDNFNIEINNESNNKFVKFEWFIHDLNNDAEFIIESDNFYYSYNDALEVGLNYGLFLILNKEKNYDNWN